MSELFSMVGKFYSSLNNILNVLGKQRNEMLVVHLPKTYCISILYIYGCEVWSFRPADMRSVDVVWNNSFCKIFNACWWESVKPLQFYLFVSACLATCLQHIVIFWLKMLNSNNLALHALANCCKDSIFGTLEKYSVDRCLLYTSPSPRD